MVETVVQLVLTADEHDRLMTVARARGVALERLIREVVEQALLQPTPAERLEAVRRMAALSLPVAEPEQMERESARDLPLA